MKKIHIEFSDERLITPSGLVFVGQILGKSSFVKKINRAPISKDYLQKQIKNGDVLLTYIGMLCQGKPQYEAVREMMDDPDYYKYALGISYAIPSAETLRQRFDMIGDSLRKDIQQANVDMLREMHIEPTALDSGNDASENIGIFMEESYKYNNVSFIIKRNPRQESKEEWLESVRECCQNIQHPRDGKTVYIGQTFRNVTYSLSDNEEKTVGIRTIYEITERTIDRYGQYFIVPDIELGTYWTNTSLPDETVIDLYHAHGESEQYHSEIKTDMDVERLPSGKFESNKLVLELTMIAYNILRIIGQESLKKKDVPGRKKIHRRRIRTVISNLMQFA